MLPPVSAASNIYLNQQETRASSIGVGSGAGMGASVGAGSAAITVVTPPRALEQNMEIAGRLNLLLLTGQERMSQNLSVLVDLLGSALKMERLPSETLSGYAVRLVEALGDLSPRERVALQRNLMRAFAGLQLRTLMQSRRPGSCNLVDLSGALPPEGSRSGRPVCRDILQAKCWRGSGTCGRDPDVGRQRGRTRNRSTTRRLQARYRNSEDCQFDSC